MSKEKEYEKLAVENLTKMINYLGLDATVSSELKKNNLVLKITSDDPGRIIGRKGQTLHSIQLILSRITRLDDQEEQMPRLILDVDGYQKEEKTKRKAETIVHQELPDEERERLEQQALDAAKEVKRWGEEVALPPMHGKERRIIHMTLKDDPEVSTESKIKTDQGKKRLVVSSR
ncbi:MAG: KH domain-containing protein [Verrucomicrobiota bacterium]|nr:KH domain-containing protein [Verrucomicrobiota bacterium]